MEDYNEQDLIRIEEKIAKNPFLTWYYNNVILNILITPTAKSVKGMFIFHIILIILLISILCFLIF